MNRHVRLASIVTVGGILVGFAAKGVGDYVTERKSSISVKRPASLPPGNLAPSERFLADYANYKKLDAEVTKLQQDSGLIEKQRLLQGTIDDLNKQVPVGYTWDEENMSFKPRAIAPAPVPPSAPTEKK